MKYEDVGASAIGRAKDFDAAGIIERERKASADGSLFSLTMPA